MPLPIIYDINSITEFKELLHNNPGLLIIKFGADWCGPCKIIKDDIHSVFLKMPNNVQSVIVDIDNSIEIYTFLKSKKMINGIPVILCYNKDNITHIPDDSIIGSNKYELMLFFERCYNKSLKYTIPPSIP